MIAPEYRFALPCRFLDIQSMLNIHERPGDVDLRHPLADPHLSAHRLKRPAADHLRRNASRYCGSSSSTALAMISSRQPDRITLSAVHFVAQRGAVALLSEVRLTQVPATTSCALASGRTIGRRAMRQSLASVAIAPCSA